MKSIIHNYQRAVRRLFSTLLLLFLTLPSLIAADSPINEGKLQDILDPKYYDIDGDLLADTPLLPHLQVDPATLVISIVPNGDEHAYAHQLNPFFNYLQSCLQRPVIFYPMQSSYAEVEAMRNGSIHIASFSAGALIHAVNRAGAIPFAGKGNEEGLLTTDMIVIVRQDSPLYNLKDLKGTRVAHVNFASSAGHLAALSLFPAEGITPGEDYEILFSGKHRQSIFGVKSGDYDAALIAQEVLDRLVLLDLASYDDFRIIYRKGSAPFAAYTYAHNLAPALKEQIQNCFYQYRFPEEMQRIYLGADRYLPLNYQEELETLFQIYTPQKLNQEID